MQKAFGCARVVWNDVLALSKGMPAGATASLVVEVETTPQQAEGKAVGMDLGLASLAVTSDGEKMAPPKFLTRVLDKGTREGGRFPTCNKATGT